MPISGLSRIDSLSMPQMLLSVVELSQDCSNALTDEIVKSSLEEDRDLLDGVIYRGSDDALRIPGIHKIIRNTCPKGLKTVLETNGSSPTVLDDIVGAGYVDIVSFVFDGTLDDSQKECLDVVRENMCTFHVTLIMDRSRINEDVLESILSKIDGAESVTLRNVLGNNRYKESEMVALAKRYSESTRTLRFL